MRSWRRPVGAAIAALMFAVPVTASAMSVAEFLVKFEALKAKGKDSASSPDMKLVMDELKSVSADYRADRAKAPSGEFGCPPPGASLGSSEFIGEFNAVPVAERETTSVKSVYYAMMKRRFPCP